jgi:hypothetical protein
MSPTSTTHSPARDAAAIPGYDFDSGVIARSPVSLEELRQLEQAVGWTNEDATVLRSVGTRLSHDKAEALVDAWRARIGAQPHLARVFFGPDGKPDEDYKVRVKKRFVQWVSDTCMRPHDQAWLDYQEEIGLRHTPAKKNRTDNAHTPAVVPLRYVVAFSAVVVSTVRDVVGNLTETEGQRFQDAWTKSVLLQIALWSRPYVLEGFW